MVLVWAMDDQSVWVIYIQINMKKSIKYLKIGRSFSGINQYIIGGYLFIFLCLIGLGIYSTESMYRLTRITEDLYVHPFTVSNAATEIKGSLYKIRSHMMQLVLLRSHEEYKIIGLESLDPGIVEDFKILKRNFYGDMTKVDELEALYQNWCAVRLQIDELVKKGDIKSSQSMMKDNALPIFYRMMPLVDYVTDFTKTNGLQFVDKAKTESNNIIKYTIILISAIVIIIIMMVLMVGRQINILQQDIKEQAITDYLTGLPNRRFFMEFAEREIQKTRRDYSPFVLVAIDLDFFKKINDLYGHHMGDKVLKKFSEISKQNLRYMDIIGRIGGEEFALILPQTNIGEGREVIERLKMAIETSEIDNGDLPALKFTASFGMTVWTPAIFDLAQLLRLADDALYEAKQNGRNCICQSIATAG